MSRIFINTKTPIISVKGVSLSRDKILPVNPAVAVNISSKAHDLYENRRLLDTTHSELEKYLNLPLISTYLPK